MEGADGPEPVFELHRYRQGRRRIGTLVPVDGDGPTIYFADLCAVNNQTGAILPFEVVIEDAEDLWDAFRKYDDVAARAVAQPKILTPRDLS